MRPLLALTLLAAALAYAPAAYAQPDAPAPPTLRVVQRGPFVTLAGPHGLALPARAPSAPSAGRRYLRATGFGILGGALGGGLGALVGRVDLDDFDRDARQRSEDAPEMAAAPLGLVLGSVVGAMGGAGAPIEGDVVFATTAGSIVGGLAGLMGGAAATGGEPWGAAVGGVLGSASGAAFGATRFRPVSGVRAGPRGGAPAPPGGAMLGVRGGRVRLGVPSARVTVIGTPVRVWRLVRVRW